MLTVIEVPLHRNGQVFAKMSLIGIPWSEFLKEGQSYVNAALARRGLVDCFAHWGEAHNITYKLTVPVYVKPKKLERGYTSMDEERLQTWRAEQMEKAMEQKLEHLRMSNYKRRYGK